MVLVGTRHQREEEDSGDTHSDPQYEIEEWFEEDEEGNEGGQASSTPLWRFVTKLEGGKVVEPLNLDVIMIVIKKKLKPYTNSYTHVRRHLCGVMESDDNKRAIGISILPKESKEERQKYIKIEEVTHKKKIQSNASSRFGGNTSPCPRGSGTFGSRRTIANFLDIGGRDEVDAKVVNSHMEPYANNFRSENYFQVIKQSTLVVSLINFTLKLLTKIKSVENNKIKDKSSTHLRHKFLCSINCQIQKFLRGKSALPTVTIYTKSEDKSVLPKTEKSANQPQQNPGTNSQFANLLTSPVRPTNVSRTDR
jgi:hypothetical protein